MNGRRGNLFKVICVLQKSEGQGTHLGVCEGLFVVKRDFYLSTCLFLLILRISVLEFVLCVCI